MVSGPLSHRYRATWVFSVIGALVAVVLVVGIGPPATFLPRATVCQMGALVGTYAIWTPDTPLNKPEGVNVSAAAQAGGWNFTFSSGSVTVGSIHPSDLSAGGWYDGNPAAGISMQGTEVNWSFYSVHNTSVIGTSSNPCTQPYIAEMEFPPVQQCGGFVTIPLIDNTSDVAEPHVWNGKLGLNSSSPEPPNCPPATPGAYIWFDISLHENGTGALAPVQWNLCNLTGSFPLILPGVAEIPVVVHAPYQGREISATGFETWIGLPNGGDGPGTELWTAGYTVPAGWLWMLAPGGSAFAPIIPQLPLPSLVAFVRLAC